LSVLIDAGQKIRWPVESPVIPGDDVGQNFFVGMPDMRFAVGVINRGGDEVFHARSVAHDFATP
jgi:hypothetical protein